MDQIWGAKVFPISDIGTIDSQFNYPTEWNPSITVLTSNVAKFCIFETSDIEDMDSRSRQAHNDHNDYLPLQPLSEGTAIKLSDKLLVTTWHTVAPYNQNKISMLVNFSSRPHIPHFSSMSKAGWVPVEIYGSNNVSGECGLCNSNYDFVFLKPRDCPDHTIVFPSNDLVSEQVESPLGTTLLVGFLSLSECKTLEDFFCMLGGHKVLSQDQCQHFWEHGNLRVTNRKLIFRGKSINPQTSAGDAYACDHVIKHDCISGSGLSGGMVITCVRATDETLKFQAMHIGKDENEGAICLKQAVFLSQRPTEI